MWKDEEIYVCDRERKILNRLQNILYKSEFMYPSGCRKCIYLILILWILLADVVIIMLGVQFDRAHEYSLTTDVQDAFDLADRKCGDDKDMVFDEFWKIQYNSQYTSMLDAQAYYDKGKSMYGSATNGSGKMDNYSIKFIIFIT
eukprot:UN02338